MFAFAIWDAPRRRLLLARDRLGVKPLYWAMAGDRLLFGSEIKSILESGLIAAEANEAALPELLSTRYLSGTETLFKGIHRLQPGHTLVFENGAVADRTVLGLPVGTPRPTSGALSDADVVRRFRALLEESVRIAADGRRAARHVPLRRPRQQRDRGADGEDDRPAAADLLGRIRAAGVQRARLRASGRDARSAPTRTKSSSTIRISSARCRGSIWHEDEPIAHPSSVPLYFVSRWRAST